MPFKICTSFACPRALASIRAIPAHFQQANVFQIGSILTCEPVLLLVQERYKYSSHRCSMKVRTADVIHCKSSLAFRLFLCVEDEERERREKKNAFTLSRSGIPLKSSAAERKSDLFMTFLISCTTNETCSWVEPRRPCQCQTNVRTPSWLLLHSCPYEERDPKRPCHDTIGLLLVLPASSTPPRTSSTKIVR